MKRMMTPDRRSSRRSPPRSCCSANAAALRGRPVDRHQPDQGHQPHRSGAQQPLDHHRGGARDLHAGRVRAGGDRVLPGEARSPRGEHELRDLRARVRGVLPRSGSRSCSAASATRATSGSTSSLSPDSLIGFGRDWMFLWGRSGFALSGVGVQRPGRRVLPLHGRVHGHHRHHPDRRHGRAVEVEGVRGLGPVLRRALLPDLRRVDLGRRLAQPARQQPRPRLRLRRLRRLRRGARHGWHRRARRARSCSVPASASTGPTASRARWRRTASRWRMLGTFILLFGWFGFNAASTFAATDLRFTVVAVNTAIAGAFGATVAMFYVHEADGQARPRHDGERHARRPGGDHRAVRVRAAVGGGGDRHRSRR